jgi:hypothetical protein
MRPHRNSFTGLEVGVWIQVRRVVKNGVRHWVDVCLQEVLENTIHVRIARIVEEGVAP